ncbi:MAG: bifunctional hydroxymethylpyrimidine kinase/phosphomethylpyrimidine kinase [Acidobacteriota bacterium]
MKRCLTIAGSDSGGGAGVQADLKTFGALGVFGMSAITAVTAQNTVRVARIQEMDPEMVASQIDAVAEDIGVDAAKTGMLWSAEIVGAVCDAALRNRIPTLVVDPVTVAKSGATLLREDALSALRSRLLPMAQLVTPNVPEAEILAGGTITDARAMRDAARRIHALGPRCVVIKGGHLEGPEAVDVAFDGRSFELFREARVRTRNTHGAGCTFSAAATAYLALGYPPFEAIARAKRFVTGAIRSAPALGRGAGPLHHFHALDRD